MRLNKSRPYGKLAGDPFIPDGSNVPAFFEQDGRFYDAHENLIGAPAEASEGEPVDPNVEPMTVADLLAQADTLTWPAFRSSATRTLGQSCPGTKSAIIEALKEAQFKFNDRAAKRTSKPAGPNPTPAAASHGVDLLAWARGQKEYLWGEVRKAIKAEFGRNVSERDDAVEFLIAQGKITANEARRDVLREPE